MSRDATARTRRYSAILMEIWNNRKSELCALCETLRRDSYAPRF